MRAMKLKALFLLLFAGALAADPPHSAAPPDAALHFSAPADGATVTSPVTVCFGLRGIGVAPADSFTCTSTRPD
jgi:hypothetical protein